MIKLAAILVVSVAVSALAYDPDYESYKAHHARKYRSVSKDESWENFNTEYGKKYRSAREAETRKTTFLSNLKVIHENHKKYERGLVKHFLGVTEFADMDHTEFKNTMAKGVKIDEDLNGVNEDVVIGGLADPPTSFDWNAQGKVTGAKRQGSCGSCWAFASMGVLEAQALISGFGSQDFSEQYLVDCFDKACDGADPRKAFLWLEQQEGAVSESSYPYDPLTRDYGEPGLCRQGAPIQKVYRMGQLSGPLLDTDLKNYVMTKGPVVVTLEAGNWPGTGMYQGGVIEFPVRGPAHSTWTKEQKDALGLHAVVIVGWDQDANGQDYWIIKNSWGTSWGNQGFGKLGMGSDQDSGVTTYYVTYAPVVPNDDPSACRAAQESCVTLEKPNCCSKDIDVGISPDGNVICTCL